MYDRGDTLPGYDSYTTHVFTFLDDVLITNAPVQHVAAVVPLLPTATLAEVHTTDAVLRPTGASPAT